MGWRTICPASSGLGVVLAGRDVLVPSGTSDSCGGPGALHADTVARCTVLSPTHWYGLSGHCGHLRTALDLRLSRVRTRVAAMRQNCNYQQESTKIGEKKRLKKKERERENGARHFKHPVSGSPVAVLWQSCGRKQIVDERSRREMQANRWATNGQHLGTHRSLSPMGYCSRLLHLVPLLSATNKKKKWCQWALHHQHWTIEEWENVAWSNKCCYITLMAESGFSVKLASCFCQPIICGLN
jgi:hypothetical protein